MNLCPRIFDLDLESKLALAILSSYARTRDERIAAAGAKRGISTRLWRCGVLVAQCQRCIAASVSHFVGYFG